MGDEDRQVAEGVQGDAATAMADATTDNAQVAGDEAVQGAVNSAIEDIARTMGWDPDHEGGKKVDAKTFILNADAITRQQHRTIDKLQKAVDSVRADSKRILEFQAEQTRQQVGELRKQLEERRRTAILEADVDAVEGIDKEINELPDVPEVKSNEGGVQYDPAYVAFEERNPWYGDDKRLTALADTFADLHANLPVPEMIKEVEREMRPFLSGTSGADSQTSEPDEDEPQDKDGGRVQRAATRHVRPAGGSNPVARGGGPKGHTSTTHHTLSELPWEMQRIVKRGVADGSFKSEQEFVDAIFAQQTTL